MQYKTTIKIITEAQDKNEALEIAGEYLSGNITSKVDMRCSTTPVHNYTRQAAGVMALCLIFVLGAICFNGVKSSQNFITDTIRTNAIQPPLKTSAKEKKAVDFRKEWQNRQEKEALNAIKL